MQTPSMIAALQTARALGLDADEALSLHESNAITLRLRPCDTVARVTPAGHGNAAQDLELVRQLQRAVAPVVRVDPRVPSVPYERDGFVITFWTWYAAVGAVDPRDYATALLHLHQSLRKVEAVTPNATDRVDSALGLLTDCDRTPRLSVAERELLVDTLRRLRPRLQGGRQQILHGEPHPGNLLATAYGPLFLDWETCCRGPVEFDLAHAPNEVAGYYPGLDHALVAECRVLMLAMITTWRWDRDDQLPDGRELGRLWLDQLSSVLSRSPDTPWTLAALPARPSADGETGE